MSRISSFIIAGVILIASVALAAFLISLAPEPTRTEQPPQVPFVQTSLVTDGTGPIPVFGSGTVRPSAEIDIVPQVGGKIAWVDPGFQSGGRIAAGQTIFRIEEVDYQYRVQEAEANLAASRVALLKEQEQASIARTQYELYSGRRELATANTLALREPQLNAARAAFDRDEARLADANLALSRTKVTAPFAGFVQEESVEVGQIVAAGQPVARIFATDAVEVIVPLSDSDAALIPGLWSLAAGDGNRTVAVRVVARYGDGTYAWDGYVDRGEASLDKQTRTIDVIVRVPDPIHAGSPLDGTVPLDGSPPLLVGEFVEVEIEGLELAGYYQVPRAALQSGNEVWIVNDDGVVGIVPVQVLQRINDEVYVIGALASGQAVITGGIQFATEGMRVLTGIDPTP
ncbi:MAG: efflux RND transporter periplasmic adaptor subunit [Gemmatimonadetes bacterium]|nr:efflux RND transporter periplasmic adaptor subunit [Gemmatimonadota bacterium]MYB71900.1 efflux RND transporter periplasmic adaptor subunit [Gemmatimonadota bacterium]